MNFNRKSQGENFRFDRLNEPTQNDKLANHGAELKIRQHLDDYAFEKKQVNPNFID